MVLNYQIIAVFTDEQLGFTGNPAACFYLQDPLTEKEMQQIATKVKQPACNFLWPAEDELHYYVRWYAVDEEIILCGHGAAAAAVFIGKKYNTHEQITLHHRNGELRVQWQNNDCFKIELEGIHSLGEIEVPDAIKEGLGIPILAMYETGGKHIILVENEQLIQEMTPDFSKLRDCSILAYAITAPGDQVDFVSRTLVPHYHQLEDFATGSSHAALVPFWAGKLQKDEMTAWQLSKRGGKFGCKWSKEEGKVFLEGDYQGVETSSVEI
jgi:PhzF family phenazine biosynthesis protein